MIEGLRQAVLYGSSAHVLSHHLRHDGADVTSPDAAPDITVYDPARNIVLAETAMTQAGSTTIYTYTLDASSTSDFGLGVDYRARVKYVISSVTYYTHFFFDVAMFPFNEPLVTTEEIAAYRPTWDLPEGWSDWTQAIEISHADLYTDIRNMRDSEGLPVYPHRLIDRIQVRKAAVKYALREAARAIGLPSDQMERVEREAENCLPTLIAYDVNDDLVKDDDETEAIGITLVH